jgi:hypothetical protein
VPLRQSFELSATEYRAFGDEMTHANDSIQPVRRIEPGKNRLEIRPQTDYAVNDGSVFRHR